jgi:Phosphodiester glycosidase
VGRDRARGARDQDGEQRPLRRIVKTRKIAPGLLFTRIVERRVPRHMFILSADLSQPITVDMTLADASMPSSRRTSEITKSHEALTAINGDFSVPGVRPIHPLAQDGDSCSRRRKARCSPLRRDETGAYIGTPDLENRGHRSGQWTDVRSGPLERGFAHAWRDRGILPVGGTLELTPAYACSARLLPDGPVSFDAAGTGVVSDFRVDVAACSSEPMPSEGGVVLSTPPATDEATQILAMTPGRVLMVVIDGRQRRWSAGSSLGELARLMLDLGAVHAMNLDGGDSSAMWVDGQLVNRPSDGDERNVTTSVLVLPGPDPGEA